ncbi:MAG: LysM peptidoglycan-binding domain-containing protein [Phycisphaerales bacterium]
MTRENKLALVVGFGLILLVGILVSDHFSPARTDAAANLSDGPAEDPSGDHLQALRAEFLAGDAAKAAQRQRSTFGGGRTDAQNRHRSQPVNADEPTVANPPRSADGRLELRGPGEAGRETPVGGDRGVPPGSTDGRSSVDVPRDEVIVPRTRDDADTDDGNAEAGALTIGTDPEAARGQLHTVRPGETLAAICRARYGDGNLWPLLARFNRIDDPNTIRENDVITLPTRERLDGRADTQPPTGRPEREPSTPQPIGPRVYVVKSTDVLSTIAQRELGTVKRMQEIVDLNRDKIDDPDDIRQGMKLTLPPT